jgi:hypothetical protein
VTAPPDRPDDALARFIAALRVRVRTVRITQALCAGAVVTLLVQAGGFALNPAADSPSKRLTLVGALVAGSLVAIVIGVSRRHSWRASAVARDAERVWPELRNHLITALELEAYPDRASAFIRAKVVEHATHILYDRPPAAVHSWRPAIVSAFGVLACAVLASFILADRPHLARRIAAAATGSATRSSNIAAFDVVVVQPSYIAGATQTLRNPERLEIVAGSRLRVRVTTDAPHVAIALGPTAPSQVSRPTAETVEAAVQPSASGVLSILTGNADTSIVDRRYVPIVLRPDAPPVVEIERPRSDLLFDRATTKVAFRAAASDDIGLASLTLHYTKVTGSGEQYAFKEGELPLALVRESPTRWRGDVTRELSALDLHEGDLLVYFARAADRRPGAAPAVSDSYVIEIGKPNAAIAGGFAVPLEEDKAALSMSALIAKTERVHAARSNLRQAELSERTASLAVEQRMVRSETLFLMGAHGEVEDEEAEAEHSNEIQEGRLENRGQADLREATRLMSAAERSLLNTETGAALTAQRAALAAMQRALSRQRYFLRTLPSRSQIDLTRRLSGDLAGARPWRRQVDERQPEPRLASLRGLLTDLSTLSRVGTTSPRSVAARVDSRDLARRLLALDPESTTLEDAARDLTRVFDTGGDWSTPPHRALLARIVAAVQQQAGPLPSAPPVPPALDAGALRGAFTDAIRREGAQP